MPIPWIRLQYKQFVTPIFFLLHTSFFNFLSVIVYSVQHLAEQCCVNNNPFLTKLYRPDRILWTLRKKIV